MAEPSGPGGRAHPDGGGDWLDRSWGLAAPYSIPRHVRGTRILIGVVRLVRGIRRWRTYRREAALVPPAEP